MFYTYSERGHSGLQEYAVFEKLNFFEKIDFLSGGSPLNGPVFYRLTFIAEPADFHRYFAGHSK
jgi:hypothetical protein